MTLKPRISQSEEWLSGTNLAASNARDGASERGGAKEKKKWRGQNRKRERLWQDMGGREGDEGLDKGDADIKLEARRIKREGEKLEQRKAGGAHRKLAARG